MRNELHQIKRYLEIPGNLYHLYRIPQPAGEIRDMVPAQDSWWIAGLVLAWLVGKAKYVPTESGYIPVFQTVAPQGQLG